MMAAAGRMQDHCFGASHAGTSRASTELDFLKEPIRQGATVRTANSRYRIADVLAGCWPRTTFGVR